MFAGAFILPSESVSTIYLMSILVVPAILVMMYGVISSSQPKTYNIIRANISLGFIASVLLLILCIILKLDLFLTSAVSLTVFSAVNGFYVSAQQREVSMVESDLPRFIMDVTEYTKMGMDLNRALIRIPGKTAITSFSIGS